VLDLMESVRPLHKGLGASIKMIVGGKGGNTWLGADSEKMTNFRSRDRNRYTGRSQSSTGGFMLGLRLLNRLRSPPLPGENR
jgi:hypothetical protein